MSAPASPLSPLNTRGGPNLSPCRRGSMAAPDPFGTLLIQDNERGMSSTLTITRAPPKIQTQGIEKARRRKSADYHAKSLSGGSPSGRISFAFSAFSPIPKDSTGLRGAMGVDTSRPASPLNPRPLPRSNSFTTIEPMRTSLTPTQVYEVAQQCNYPQSRPSTPGGNGSLPSTPVSYTPLPEAVYLPFLNRPREVESLISTPPTSTLFSLLALTFPASSNAEDDTEPARWTYAKLEQWLTKVDRNEAEDLEWVQKAKTCISTRSELIWERVKGALGVPPELDISPHDIADSSGASRLDFLLDDSGPEKGVVEAPDYFEEAWVEPIVPAPSPHSLPHTPTTGRSPSLGRQSMSRMEDISEDAPGPDQVLSSPSAVHGLRIITSPSEPPARIDSGPMPTSAGSFSQPHVPYDAVAERGPGNPLFPSSFANLAIGPTLSANNPALRSPAVPPPSAYPLQHSISLARRKAPSWAEGWDPQRQEYAVSIASDGSKKGTTVE